MDLSSEYIKMCTMAMEVQNNWDLLESGDFYYDVFGCFINTIDKTYSNIPKKDIEERNHSEYIWLPRQDQLQEMIFSADKRIRAEYCLLQDPESDNNYDLYHYSLVFSGDSIEQCWLKVVMKEKYNKTWNGEDWI